MKPNKTWLNGKYENGEIIIEEIYNYWLNGKIGQEDAFNWWINLNL